LTDYDQAIQLNPEYALAGIYSGSTYPQMHAHTGGANPIERMEQSLKANHF
jgi:hypothetical protein